MPSRRPLKQWLIALALMVGVVGCGFLQERVKINVNFVLEKGSTIPGFFQMSPEQREATLHPIKSKGNFDYYYSHESLGFVYTLNETQLNILKWVITITSILIFTVLDLGIFWWFRIRKHLYKYYFVLSASLLILGAGVYFLGATLKLMPIFYPISRGILGVLQSPILSLILVPVFKKLDETPAHGND